MTTWWRTRRLDATEAALGALLVAAVAGTAAAVVALNLQAERYARLSYVAFTASQEGERLKARYGPSRHSRNEEEWVIRDYFQDRRGGSFVDVGANHYKIDSNTYYLESALEWSGIAIDPQAEFEAGYREHRPRTRFFAFFVSDTSGDDLTFYLPEGHSAVASADRSFAEQAAAESGTPAAGVRPVTVPTIRLTDLLDRLGIARFDLLSVDVELAEPRVLAGFDIDRFRPSLVCIEAHPQVRQAILDYFAGHGYVLQGRYLRVDLQNLYFAPAGPRPAGAGVPRP